MAKTPDKYTYNKVEQIYQELRNERSEWEQDARSISEWILPGRGIYQTYTKPRKRKLTSHRVINTIAEDALYVLTSGIHGRLTSPAMPWFHLTWPNAQLKQIEMLVAWLQQAEHILHAGLHASNFYSIIHSFYVEYAGFGTASLYVGDDTYDDNIPFRFELLTFGEYAFSTGADGLSDIYCRTIFKSPRQLYEQYPDTVSKDLKRRVEANESGVDKIDLAILEFIAKDDSFQDKNFVRYVYEVTGTGRTGTRLNEKPLAVDGFYEHPYQTGRWSTIGSDVYGIGPGSRAVPDVKRLQEMEKAGLLATHKSINPALNVPAKMRGKTNTLPGGHNYYSNPAEVISEVANLRYDFPGVGATIERVEQRIQRNFYNDVFLTASRDPNASPLKATQVIAQDQEETFRLGPVVERLNSEVFQPTIRRCFNIMHRQGLFPPLEPQFEELIAQMEINLVSPMATAQNQVRGQGTDAFAGFVANMAQFDQAILDNINPDAAARQRAEIEGVDFGVLRTQEEVDEIRKARAEAQAAEKAKQEQMIAAQAGSTVQNTSAQTQKTQAETGQILAESQATAQEAGLGTVQ